MDDSAKLPYFRRYPTNVYKRNYHNVIFLFIESPQLTCRIKPYRHLNNVLYMSKFWSQLFTMVETSQQVIFKQNDNKEQQTNTKKEKAFNIYDLAQFSLPQRCVKR